MTDLRKYTPCMSKAHKILSANLSSLIGEGNRFRNDSDMGERTGLGQRAIHRIRTQEVVPKLDTLDTLAQKLRIPLPALLSPGMDVLEGSLPQEIGDVLRRIITLAHMNALEAHDVMHLSSSVSLIEKSKGAVSSVSESTKRGTGT